MAVKVTFELKMQDGKTEEMIDLARQAFSTTRQYDGCK
jgi:quinol monooxygenase YgiN